MPAADRDEAATVRPATVADADAVARVHVAAWLAAYPDLLPQPPGAAGSVERRRRQWRELLAQPGQETLLIELDGVVVGFANFGPARDDDLPPSVAEIYAIYLEPARWRRGLGSTVWRESCARLARRGFDEVAVWALHDNERALGFYRSRGLAPDGWLRSESERGQPVDQIRLRGPLAAAG